VFVSVYADISMEHHSRVGGGPTLPLLLILGFTSGYSVWQISVRPPIVKCAVSICVC